MDSAIMFQERQEVEAAMDAIKDGVRDLDTALGSVRERLSQIQMQQHEASERGGVLTPLESEQQRVILLLLHRMRDKIPRTDPLWQSACGVVNIDPMRSFS